MISGIAGTLLSHDAIAHVLPDALRGLLDESGRERARERLHAWHVPLRRELGPATGARRCFDRLAAPLLAQMGYRVLPCEGREGRLRALLQTDAGLQAVALVTAWGQNPSAAWRDCVHHGIAHGVRWCLCITGPLLRVIDSRRTYSRQYVEFEIASACDRPATFAVFWGLLRAEAMKPASDGSALLDRAIALSEAHRSTVRDALQHGVREALLHLVQAFRSAARRAGSAGTAGAILERRSLEESLVVIYRVLFLLFAEARGMVPRWHPTYRHSYTIEALRGPIEHLPRPAGLWEALQAIARLAHGGCHVGALRVTPFNGRLFSPADSPLADSLRLDDEPVRRAMLALTTRDARGGRRRIAYADLGVEHLGGVYERLLDFDVEVRIGRGPRFVRSEQRKATGSFYTPRTLTEYLVRRTLSPLVADASPERVLALRVLDPAMGSGAFLVAACRYLAAAYEAALVREGALVAGEIDELERTTFRRAVAQRCLYGVDANPMAVQLARLSLWLATLAADRPLTFLDHRLRAGNSLVGASPADVARQPPRGGRVRRAAQPLPLFADDADVRRAIRHAALVRTAIAVEPGETLEQVRGKERALASLSDQAAGVHRWKAVADLWCASWFGDAATRRSRCAAFPDLADRIRTGSSVLPDRLTHALLAETRALAERTRFFHWTLEFPEIFSSDGVEARGGPGFDAVLGNPPWEMLRGDRGSDDLRSSGRAAAAGLVDFARGSGVYCLQGNGHPNLYQLFLERSLSLLRRGGRLGLLLPSGFATDRGSARLRRAILDETDVDSCVSLENRDGIFPIHRGVKFMALTLSPGGHSSALPCRFGLRRVETLDSLPDLECDPAAIHLPRALLDRVSGGDLAIPDVRTPTDLDILSHVTFTFPVLGDPDWAIRFGRELNASDDRHHFLPAGRGLPVLEGKQVTAFRAEPAAARFGIRRATAARLLDASRTFDRPRLAYRDVAACTNQRTLIAAIVPPGVVTTHTLFCLKDCVDELTQQYLCGMFNSLVADYLIRLRVNTHVSANIIERLPVPRPTPSDPRLREVATLAEGLASAPDPSAGARLQALAARLYRLSREQFRHVLATFPLVPQPDRDAAFSAFCDIVPSSGHPERP